MPDSIDIIINIAHYHNIVITCNINDNDDSNTDDNIN